MNPPYLDFVTARNEQIECVGPMAEADAVRATLVASGWRVTRDGPHVKNRRVDVSRFHLIAVRALPLPEKE